MSIYDYDRNFNSITANLANKISDVKKLSDDRKGNISQWAYRSGALWSNPQESQSVELPKSFGGGMKLSSSMPAHLSLNSKAAPGGNGGGNSQPASRLGRSGRQTFAPSTSSPSKRSQGGGMVERPASRAEISALEHELEDRVRLVLDDSFAKNDDNEFSKSYAFEPHREAMMITREKMFKEFGADPALLEAEPWLDSFIKCECLKEMCDDISSKFADVLAVNSLQLGNMLRKLRLTYKQCFEQMHYSWKDMRQSYLQTSNKLAFNAQIIERLKNELDHKEEELNRSFDVEVQRLNAEFNAEKQRDAEKLLQTEFKMEQMSDTLKYLNGIFKTMQSDGATMKSADLQSRCMRLEKENAELLRQNASLDLVKTQLAAAEQRIKQLEAEVLVKSEEKKAMTIEIRRRDEVVAGLMEREAVRNAEIEKLQKISKMKDDELVAVDLKDSAISVLCIKCKKSLDDLTNIRSAIMGDTSATQLIKTQCYAFRILLPNLRGRRPNRSVKWIRNCMRCILFAKLREDVNLQFIKGQTTPFPAFVYAWFVRYSGGRIGSQLTKQLALADEDRWGFYYGLKALAKEDPESAVFWSLLDESFGDDGSQFALYCLCVLLSIGGKVLWKQFGPALNLVGSINLKPAEDSSSRPVIYIDVETAKEAVRLILVRAMSTHINDAMDAIEALKVRPNDLDLKAMQMMAEDDSDVVDHEEETAGDRTAAEDDVKSIGGSSVAASLNEGASMGGTVAEGDASASALASAADGTAAVEEVASLVEDPVTAEKLQSTLPQEPTHINVFMWLRLMMQQMHADQIQRSAAIRLMFETASVGALTPQLPTTSTDGRGSSKVSGSASSGFAGASTHVEYPQFQSICQTLFPNVPVGNIAQLYHHCHDSTQGRVNAEVFTKMANRFKFFTHALRLPLLPLLRSYQRAMLTTGPATRSREAEEDAAAGAAATAAAAAGAARGNLSAVAAKADVMVVDLGGDGRSMSNTMMASRTSDAHDAADDDAQRMKQLQEEKELEENNKRMYSARTEQAVRSKLATLVHRKFASIAPAIQFLVDQLPERWRVMVEDAMETVTISLNDSHVKMRLQQQEQNRIARTSSTVSSSRKSSRTNNQVRPAAVSSDVPSLSFIDGLQPYFAYRRLLLLIALVKALCDNPMLPTELFAPSDLENNEINIDQSMYRAERVLSNLEQSLLTVPMSSPASKSSIGRLIDRYHNFEAVRRTLIARRLQNCARKFLGRDVAVPRSVRLCLSAGYMGTLGEPHSSSNSGSNSGGRPTSGMRQITLSAAPQKPMLYSREVYTDPWWGTAQVAETYRFKITYDMKASSLGLPPITLAQAVAAAQYCRWGVMELAERAVHDIFVSVRAYRYGVPRLRLFAAFLGDGRDLEDIVAEMLRTPHAFAVYVSLLMELHQVLLLEQQVNLQRAKKRFSNADAAAGAAGAGGKPKSEMEQLGVEAKGSTAAAAAAAEEKDSSAASHSSAENCFKRHDKRDVWTCSVHLLIMVAERWSQRQLALHGNTSLYTELPEKLRVNPLGEAEVDDFLWIMMVQWAKLAGWHVRRSEKAAVSVERNHPVGRHDVGEVLGAEGVGGGGVGGSRPPSPFSSSAEAIKVAAALNEQRRQTLALKNSFARLPLLPMGNLRTVVESAYRPGEGGLLTDAQHYTFQYVSNIAVRKDNLNVPADSDLFTSSGAAAHSYHSQRQRSATKFAAAMEKLLQECVLWDTNDLTAGQRIAVQSVVSAALDPAMIAEVQSGGDGGSSNSNSNSKESNGGAAAAGSAGAAAGGGMRISGEFASTALAVLRTSMLQLHAVSPEVSFAIARQAFTAYQGPFKSFLNTVSLYVERSGDADLERRVQSARIVMLSLAEMFHQHDGDFASFKLHAHEANCSSDAEISDALRSSLQHLQQILPPAELQRLRSGRDHMFSVNREAWTLLMTLMSSVSELAILTKQDLPTDPWHGGAKVHVDRAFVYSIHTKSNPQA